MSLPNPPSGRSKIFASLMPPEVRATLESAGATLTADPATGALKFALNGYLFARIEADPPAVVWASPAFGQFLGTLFEYKEWAEETLAAKGMARDMVLARPKAPPDLAEAQAAGLTVSRSGNGLTGYRTSLSHPALGEFVRLGAVDVSFSSPQVFVPLRFLVEMDRLFTPVPYGTGSDQFSLSPYMAGVYNARLRDLAPVCRDIGVRIGTMSITSADAEGGKEAAFDVDLEWDPDENPDARMEAYRAVLAAYGPDRDMVRVLIDFHDLLDGRAGRLVADTSDLSPEIVSDGPAFDAFAISHAHGLYGEMRRLCDLWETEIGYVDSDLRALIKSEGGPAAARAVLAEPEQSVVISRLAAADKITMSVEYLVLRPEWRSLFTADERRIAWSRLSACGLELDYPYV